VSEPYFLTIEQVLELQVRAIRRYGGTTGVRDVNLLESAVYQPRNVHLYGQGDLFEVAAAYAFHIAEAQAFFDGNKRTGISAALTFLRGNGVVLKSDPNALYDAMIGIAEKRMTREQLAEILRRPA
jgi:death-on-curing protein